MSRIIRFVVRNWPLKLAAIGLATILYAGFAVSQTASVWRGDIPIEPINQPTDAVVLGALPSVTSVRYFTLDLDAASRVTSESFKAWADFAEAVRDPESPYVSVPVKVEATDSRIRVIDFTPNRIQVRLDPLVSALVPVRVDRGEVPPGLEVQDPVVSQSSVTVFGPQSVVRTVVAAVARVQIQPSGLSVDQTVDLVAVDARGEVLGSVRIEPPSVRVTIKVGSRLSNRSLPVNPIVTANPAPGYRVAGISVNPILVTVEGDADELAALTRVDTAPLSIDGATSTVTQAVPLALPEGMTALGVRLVEITVDIEPENGTRSLTVAVVPRGARPDRTYLLGAEAVTVTLGGPLAALEEVAAGSFTGSVDVSGLDTGTMNLPVEVKVPPGVTLVGINPATISVTAIPPPTPEPTVVASPGSTAEPAPAPSPTSTPEVVPTP